MHRAQQWAYVHLDYWIPICLWWEILAFPLIRVAITTKKGLTSLIYAPIKLLFSSHISWIIIDCQREIECWKKPGAVRDVGSPNILSAVVDHLTVAGGWSDLINIWFIYPICIYM